MPSSTMPNYLILTVGAVLMFFLGYTTDVMMNSRVNNASHRGLQEVVVEENNIKQKDGWGTVNVYYGEELKKTPGRWYGQALQDKEALELLGYKRNGYFIDLAACVPGWSSNTLALEHDYDWKGLAMDADHSVWHDLSRRNVDVVGVVVGKNDKELIPYNFFPAVGGSGIIGTEFDTSEQNAKNRVMRYTASLITIFKKFNVPQIIDYFSLDVEGAEWFIMEHFPFDQYMFRVMTIERPGDNLKELMKKYGYVFVKKLFAERDGKDFGEELWAHESVLRGKPEINNNESVQNIPEQIAEESAHGKLEKIDGKVTYVGRDVVDMPMGRKLRRN